MLVYRSWGKVASLGQSYQTLFYSSNLASERFGGADVTMALGDPDLMTM